MLVESHANAFSGELVKEENFGFSDSEAAERLLINRSKVNKRKRQKV